MQNVGFQMTLACVLAPFANPSILGAIQEGSSWRLFTLDLKANTSTAKGLVSEKCLPILGGVRFHSGTMLAIQSSNQTDAVWIIDPETGKLLKTIPQTGEYTRLGVPSGEGLSLLTKYQDGSLHSVLLSPSTIRGLIGITAKSESKDGRSHSIEASRIRWQTAIDKSGLLIGPRSMTTSGSNLQGAFGILGCGAYAALTADGRRCVAFVREVAKPTEALTLRLFEMTGSTATEVTSTTIRSKGLAQMTIVGPDLILRYDPDFCEVRPLDDLGRVKHSFRSLILIP